MRVRRILYIQCLYTTVRDKLVGSAAITILSGGRILLISRIASANSRRRLL